MSRRIGYERKERNHVSRRRIPCIVFALEGNNETEKLYLTDMARDYASRINFKYAKGNNTDPIHMMKALIAEVGELEKSGEVYAFSLVDSDFVEHKNKEIQEADQMAKKYKTSEVRQIVSGPCFEIWFICHFSDSTAQYTNSNEVISRLRDKIPEYGKSMRGMYERIKGDQARAVQNAERLRKHCEKAGYKVHTTQFQPSTEMDEVIKKIEQLIADRAVV